MSEQPNPSDHGRHDLVLIAALADRDASGEEAERARALIAACAECAALHADLVSLAQATRQLPAIARPRDFQLRPADAQRLRPNLVRRLLGSLGTARDGFSRPLAMGLTTLGLAGLLLGVLPGTLSLGSGGGTLSGAATERYPTVNPMSAASAPAAEPGASAGFAPAVGPAAQEYTGGGAVANPAPAGEEFDRQSADNGVSIAGEDTLTAVTAEASGVSVLVVVSGTLLIIGLGLFALRWTSRRFGG